MYNEVVSSLQLASFPFSFSNSQHPFSIPFVSRGLRDAIYECQQQFKMERWERSKIKIQSVNFRWNCSDRYEIMKTPYGYFHDILGKTLRTSELYIGSKSMNDCRKEKKRIIRKNFRVCFTVAISVWSMVCNCWTETSWYKLLKYLRIRGIAATKESSYLAAIASAGIVYAVTKVRPMEHFYWFGPSKWEWLRRHTLRKMAGPKIKKRVLPCFLRITNGENSEKDTTWGKTYKTSNNIDK